ncbi:MAG: ABC transporter ATP-binding protein [Clostridiales bacterium]|nr:ABC transporter ATP-binding protein [Clostridiales bacterium]
MENRQYRLLDLFRINYGATPLASATSAALRLAQGLLPLFRVAITAHFIDRALAVAAGAPLQTVWLPLTMVGALVAVEWFARDLAKLADDWRRLAVARSFRARVVNKCARLAYRHIENPDTWDLITRVSEKPEDQAADGFAELHDLASLAISMVGVAALLANYAWWAALTIAALSAPLLWLSSKSGKANYQADRDTQRARRRSEYFKEVLLSRDTAEERALFGFSPALAGEYMREFLSAYRVKRRTTARWFVKMKLGSVAYSAISLLAALMLIGPAIEGKMTIGVFMSLVTATFSLVQAMSWNLTGYTDQLARRREYMKDLTKFFALDEADGALDAPADPPMAFEKIELKDVRFAYPGTEKYVLDGLSLTLEAGRHYAFVGVNGAGKTTLTKLLAGLYSEYEGEIRIDGRELRTIPRPRLTSLYALVFQDFARYWVPARDDIAFGYPAREARIDEVAGQIGLKTALDALPQGLDTPLGKLVEGGSDLSGGQWQRLAIARALVNPAPIRILDEPTAALDPIGESELYREFKRQSGGVTTLFISHRLGSTLLADEILVLSDGRVAERGDHAVLMARGGLYAEMYDAQRSWYQ